MQIKNTLQSSNIDVDLGSTKPTSPSTSRQGTKPDQVQISDLAFQLSSDSSKFAELQASYEAGTYNVSASQIASSILNDAMLS